MIPLPSTGRLAAVAVCLGLGIAAAAALAAPGETAARDHAQHIPMPKPLHEDATATALQRIGVSGAL